ncbi:MAG TPA: TIGR02147 family protein, partial [Polyangiales bacterium]|nr:TIGR02147 family protein [Polyangiales bacterium]
MASRAAVDVFAYRDYRAFLQAYYERRKAQKDGFSHAAFSEAIGLRSANYLKLVIDGGRNLTPDLAHRFGEGCGLRDDALSYFCALVAFNQAKSGRERSLHYEKLQSFKRFRASYRLDGAQSAYYSQWFIPAVHELCARPDFDPDPRWIARALLPPISPKQASQALDVLAQLGLLVRDEHGRWSQAEAVVETPEGPLGHHVAQFHRAMMQRAADALDVVPREEREIGALTLCLSEAR